MHIGVGEGEGENGRVLVEQFESRGCRFKKKKIGFVIGVQHAAPNELRKRVFLIEQN
jgi:hypothetical protein